MEGLEILVQDVKEIKEHVIELVKKAEVHNHILQEHEKRSTALEAKIDPLEKDHLFRQRLMTLLFGSGGVVGLAYAAIRLIEPLLK